MLFKYSRLYEEVVDMFLFDIVIYEYDIEFIVSIWADDSRDAIECGYEMYPDAIYVDIA